jgi:hypothetical protein
MEDHLKVDWARRLGFGSTPEKLPQKYIDFYEKHRKNTLSMVRNREPDRSEWDLIITLTDMLDEQNKRILSLEDQVRKLQSGEDESDLPLCTSEGEHDPTVVDVPHKEHWKTRQKRERETATVGA